MDVCFWLDIAINFRTAYYAGEFGDELVSEWRKIARRYACSWLALTRGPLRMPSQRDGPCYGRR